MVGRFYNLAAAATAAMLMTSLSASAHHSFAGQFDRNLPVAFEGIVTRIEWQNPHVWVYVDAEDEDGNVIHWEIEMTTPNVLLRRGWARDDLKVGDRVSANGFRAICCENVMNAQGVTLPDGRSVFSGGAR